MSRSAIAVVSGCVLGVVAPARANTLDAPAVVMADKTGAFSYVAVFTAKDPVNSLWYGFYGSRGDNIVGCCSHIDCFCGCLLAPGEELGMQASGFLLNPSEKGYVRAFVDICSGEDFQVTTTVMPWSPIEVVPVGNPGNDGELSGEAAGGQGPTRICGAVDYAYNMGKYEVTAGQYTEFLNAVAATDTYGLYNRIMSSSSYLGCMIERTGSSPNYSYSVVPDWADRPVNHVSWGDAARFANWLHNGQPTGTQDLTTTEDGSYYLDGATSAAELLDVIRELDATWVIPSEDEWYKAAYYDGDSSVYYDYPTSSDSVPSNDLIDPDPGNNANFYDSGPTIGDPYYRTVVGDFENSESPYGTFDQGGNMWELNEAILSGSYRGGRGGAFHIYGSYLLAAYRGDASNPTNEDSYIGFRVAEVPVLDFNGDGNVDLRDFALFQADFGGDVDLHYFAWFQENFTGPLP